MPSRRIKRGRAHITDELMINILSRLPSRSLRRFVCVSKTWASLISQRIAFLPMCGLYCLSGDFAHIEDHHIYASIKEDKQVEEYCQKLESSIRTLRCFSTSILVNGCNGLFLFVENESTQNSRYFVCNPATMECVTLPPESLSINLWSYGFLAYDPRESPHYRVLLFILQWKKPMMLEIYSSMTDEWVEHSLPYDLPLRDLERTTDSVYLNRTLYLLDFQSYLVVGFDVERGSFNVLMLPNEPVHTAGKPHIACIGISRGHLYYAAINCFRLNIEIWILVKEGNVERWLLKHSMGTQTFVRRLLPPYYEAITHHILPLSFHPDSEVIYIRTPTEILSYHPDNMRLELVCTIMPNKYDYLWTRTLIVTPSLESINPPGSTIIRW